MARLPKIKKIVNIVTATVKDNSIPQKDMESLNSIAKGVVDELMAQHVTPVIKHTKGPRSVHIKDLMPSKPSVLHRRNRKSFMTKGGEEFLGTRKAVTKKRKAAVEKGAKTKDENVKKKKKIAHTDTSLKTTQPSYLLGKKRGSKVATVKKIGYTGLGAGSVLGLDRLKGKDNG